MARQLNLISTWRKDRFAFGGAKLARSHAKTKRPFVAKLPIHIVMRSTQARGAKSLLNYGAKIEEILSAESAKHGVRVHGAANAGNHLHLLLEAPSKAHLSALLRALSGRIAMLVSGARKGHPIGTVGGQAGRFWDQRPFSRIVSRGRDFFGVLRYIVMNSTEVGADLSRIQTQSMFREIRAALRSGLLRRTPGLVAAGFI